MPRENQPFKKTVSLGSLELLSYEPVHFPCTGGIISPLLKDIAKIGCARYNAHLNVLSLTPGAFYRLRSREAEYDALSAQEQAELSVYDLILSDRSLLPAVEEALDFFFVETVRFEEAYQAFFTYDGTRDPEGNLLPTGAIHRDFYGGICDAILLRNYLKPRPAVPQKAAGKRALSILKKLERGRAEQKGDTPDTRMELGNIISAVAGRHPGLDIRTIWDITVYQLWDAFFRLCSNQFLDLQARSVAVWGDKHKRFDATAWYQTLKI